MKSLKSLKRKAHVKKILERKTTLTSYQKQSTSVIDRGKEGNGAQRFTFTGKLKSGVTSVELVDVPEIITVVKAQNGGNIEPLDSIKYFSPF